MDSFQLFLLPASQLADARDQGVRSILLALSDLFPQGARRVTRFLPGRAQLSLKGVLESIGTRIRAPAVQPDSQQQDGVADQ